MTKKAIARAVLAGVAKSGRRVVVFFGFDRDDARLVVKIAIQLGTVVAWSAAAGVAVHTFISTSGIGRAMGWDF